MRISLKRIENAGLLARSPQARRAALFSVAGNVLADATPLVPRREGALQGSGRAFVSAADTGIVEWGGDGDTARYARAQHAGTNGIVRFKEYTTPGTGAGWTGKAEDERLDAWREMFAREYARGLRG